MSSWNNKLKGFSLSFTNQCQNNRYPIRVRAKNTCATKFRTFNGLLSTTLKNVQLISVQTQYRSSMKSLPLVFHISEPPANWKSNLSQNTHSMGFFTNCGFASSSCQFVEISTATGSWHKKIATSLKHAMSSSEVHLSLKTLRIIESHVLSTGSQTQGRGIFN